LATVVSACAAVVVAIFTGVLARKTASLYSATIQTANAAEQSAKAAMLQSKAVVAIELPTIGVEVLLLSVGSLEAAHGGSFIDGGLAILLEQSANLKVAHRLPLPPNYTIVSGFAPDAILRPEDVRESLEGNSFFNTPEAREDVAAGRSFLWAYGYLKYRDFMGELHEKRFCYRWLGVHPGFLTTAGFVYDSATPEEYLKSY
jgi:hypothetical protein